MRNAIWLAVAPAAALPALWLRISGSHTDPAVEAVVFGIAILGAAFLLTWGVEVAQKDLTQAFAVAILAFIAVLPEYAVDMFFAYSAAARPEYAAYAAANMTGANRLLVGIGWPLIVLLFWLRTRAAAVSLRPEHRLELLFLGAATLYAFLLPVKGSISLIDAVVLINLFALYVWATTRTSAEEPHLMGPAALLGSLPDGRRRSATAALFLFSAGVIVASAEPFAEGLVTTGKLWNIDEFLLVQWLAPLASEAPEIAIASIFTLRGQAVIGMGALLSSKINQWTLLIGTLPVAYSIGVGAPGALPLDARQAEEVFLTAAQSAFALMLLVTLRLSVPGALALLLLFTVQLVIPDHAVRLGVAIMYLLLCAALLVVHQRRRALAAVVGVTWRALG